MPTATVLSQRTFNNLGPLTTTFTVPASCATLTNNVYITTNKGRDLLGLDCNTKTSTLGDCYPSGSSVDAILASFAGNPERGEQLHYFSPGIQCPSAWTTAGVAAKDASGSLSASGVFTSASAVLYNSVFVDLVLPNILAANLAAGETAAVCCPGGFTTEQGSCVSTLASSQPITGGCAYLVPHNDYTFIQTTMTLPQTTATGGIFSLTDTSPLTLTSITFRPGEAKDWASVAVMPMVTLLHQASDLPGGATSSSEGTAKSQSPSSQADTVRAPGVQMLLAACLIVWVMASAAVGGLFVMM